MNSLIRQGSVIVCAGLLSCAALAQDGPTAPRVISGGIGAADQQRLEQEAVGHNLRLLLTDTRGQYLAGVDVALRDAQGDEVLRLTSEGPMVLAALPPGRYTVEAEFEGERRQQAVSVPARGHRQLVLRWPADDGSS